MRHYTLKRIVVRAEDAEKGTSGKPEQGNGEGHSEERASEPMNDHGDEGMKTTVTDVEVLEEKQSVEGSSTTVS